MDLQLTKPSLDLFDSWAAAIAEFGDDHIDGSGLPDDFVPDRASCADFVEKAELYGRRGVVLPDDKVPCDYHWITDGGEVVGFIAFRRELNDFLRRVGGHIGYSVRPSRRREGIVTEALRMQLDLARADGYERVMITCDDDNPGSYRTIERAGGELQDRLEAPENGHPLIRRYWVTL
ncbi:GNAT family N-acetyltransferase [Microbacterium sp.]|uniref:GNAT family N-acetyltransferase n=1 Tax=Microbacterium sp. TaxID=51671 RepID=UPI00333FF5B5